MQELYRKVNKTSDNLRGFVQIDEENPFTKPCLLCLSAQSQIPKSVFGIAKVGASLARVRVRGKYNAGFDIDTVPVSFLASTLTDSDSDIIDFVEKYFIPLVYNNGQRLSLEDACKAFRNINILTYCNGTLKTLKMETYLNYKLKAIGYEQEEVDQILRQIFVMPIATELVQGNEKVSMLSFKDVRDEEVLVKSDMPFYRGAKDEDVFVHSDHAFSFLYKGDGEHDLRKYAYIDDVMAYISFVLTYVLDNSIENSRSDSFIPLDLQSKVEKLELLMGKKLDKDRILKEIDDRLEYVGATKLTPKESLLMDRFEIASDKMISQEREIASLRQENVSNSKKLRDVQQAIGRYCSDTTGLRILLEAIGWQVSKADLEKIMNTPTDREVVENLDVYESEMKK